MAKNKFKRGVVMNPKGRPRDTINRINAVMDAICVKVKIEGYDGVVKWLSGLDDSVLAGLYGKLLPKDCNINAVVTLSFEDCLARMDAKPCSTTVNQFPQDAPDEAQTALGSIISA